MGRTPFRNPPVTPPSEPELAEHADDSSHPVFAPLLGTSNSSSSSSSYDPSSSFSSSASSSSASSSCSDDHPSSPHLRSSLKPSSGTLTSPAAAASAENRSRRRNQDRARRAVLTPPMSPPMPDSAVLDVDCEEREMDEAGAGAKEDDAITLRQASSRSRVQMQPGGNAAASSSPLAAWPAGQVLGGLSSAEFSQLSAPSAIVMKAPTFSDEDEEEEAYELDEDVEEEEGEVEEFSPSDDENDDDADDDDNDDYLDQQELACQQDEFIRAGFFRHHDTSVSPSSSSLLWSSFVSLSSLSSSAILSELARLTLLVPRISHVLPDHTRSTLERFASGSASSSYTSLPLHTLSPSFQQEDTHRHHHRHHRHHTHLPLHPFHLPLPLKLVHTLSYLLIPPFLLALPIAISLWALGELYYYAGFVLGFRSPVYKVLLWVIVGSAATTYGWFGFWMIVRMGLGLSDLWWSNGAAATLTESAGGTTADGRRRQTPGNGRPSRGRRRGGGSGLLRAGGGDRGMD